MKNQDKILEVLSESLRIQDRQTEILTKHGLLLEKLVDGQNQLVQSQLTTNSKLESVDERLGSMDYKFDRMFDLIKDDVLPRLNDLEKGEG